MAQTLKQQIRKVIRQHYRDDLAIFRDDTNYRNSTEAFVDDIARAIKGKIEYVTDLPNEVAKYCKATHSDRKMGKIVGDLRIEKGITVRRCAV